MPYQHIEIELNQASYSEGQACGDVFWRAKKKEHTTIILCDGKGHGIKANIAATMNISYLENLIDSGFSARAAFDNLIDFFANTGTSGSHYAVFAIARIFNDGMTNILSYAIPPPILISARGASVLQGRAIETSIGTMYEANCYLKKGEGIMLMSDGITSAGIGRTLDFGWGSENLCKFIDNNITPNNINYAKLSKDIMAEVYKICNNNWDDDVTNAIAFARDGKVVNFLSGPPKDKKQDALFVRKFMALEGKKVLCGGTTANIVAKTLNKTMELDANQINSLTPPQYYINGIDLATEGAVTLNQLYNVIDEDRSLMDSKSPVTQLYDQLMNADRINMFQGGNNLATEESMDFIQRGIKARRLIVPLIAEKLQQAGKLVVLEEI